MPADEFDHDKDAHLSDSLLGLEQGMAHAIEIFFWFLDRLLLRDIV